MINYVQPGDVLTLTAPSGGVVKGGVYLIGSLLVVATMSAAQTLPFTAAVTGIFNVKKAAGTAWTEGVKVYWDVADNEFNTSSGGNTLAGVGLVAASAAVVGPLRLDGVAR